MTEKQLLRRKKKFAQFSEHLNRNIDQFLEGFLELPELQDELFNVAPKPKNRTGFWDGWRVGWV